MPRASAVNRAVARRATKRQVETGAASKRTLGSLFQRLDSLGSVAILVVGCCVATGALVRHTVYLDYKAALDAEVRVVAGNVATCVRTGRGLDVRSAVPVCLDPADGSAAATDAVPFPAAKPKPAVRPAPAANAAAAKPKVTRPWVSPVALAYGRGNRPLFPTRPPVLRIVAPAPKPVPKPRAVSAPTSAASVSKASALSPASR